MYFVICVTIATSASADDWKSIPPPPQIGNYNLGIIKNNTIAYRHYKPGQIILENKRFRQLIRDIQWSLSKKKKTTVINIIITGYADKMEIGNHQEIWSNIPASVRPPTSAMVDNEIIAQGRATYIIERVSAVLDYRLPSIVKVNKKTGLPISPTNRGIDIHLNLPYNKGIKE